MHGLNKRALWGAGLVCIALLGLAAIAVRGEIFARGQAQEASGADSEAPAQADDAVAVRTIRPKCDPSFSLSVKAPAQVMPYEWADLEAQVAGTVQFIRKAEGSPVTAGELLVRIAVPDLEAELNQKESIIRQKEADWKYAQAKEKIAQTALKVAASNIAVHEAEVDVAKATEDYRGKLFHRLQGLVADKAATQQVVEEGERDYMAAVADTRRAKASVLKANADYEEAQAKLVAAGADVQLQKELVEVARKDRDRTQALANYARITAPFDGVITRRNVNRGSFVQNATTGHPEPVLRVERRDIVTVYMRVPDTFAAYVTNATEAVIELSELPGEVIHGKVTRFSPTLESEAKDHTLLVEVDLFNGTEAEYRAFLTKEKVKTIPFDDLKEGPLPLCPTITGQRAEGAHRLYPGMYGEMQLVLRSLSKVYLLPSDAVVRQGGTPYLFLVKNGKAVLVPVEVQVDDQKLAKVSVISKTAKGVIKSDLTGNEEVITSNQSELSDGQAVKPIPQEWMPE
jgi:multidrug resistance efflux pump